MILLFSALLVISLVAMLCAFLLPRKKTKPAPLPAPQPLVSVIRKEVIYDETPGRNYPLKVYLYFENTSSRSLSIEVSSWSGISAVLFRQVLQVWEWLPNPHGATMQWWPAPHGAAPLTVAPGQNFRLWIGPHSAYSADALDRLCKTNRLGTLTLLLNNQDRSFVV
jgi:hypothetical protein